MLEVALDDGSRGWISPEALCDSAWVKVVNVDLNSLESESRKNYLKNNPRHLNSNTYWYKLGDRCWTRYSTRESDDKRVITLYDEDRKTSYKAYGNTGDSYVRLSREILMNCLDKAYRYLPETDSKFPRTISCNPDVFCGMTREEVETVLGDPHAVAGPGLSIISGHTYTFYEDIVCPPETKCGLLVIYDAKGIVAKCFQNRQRKLFYGRQVSAIEGLPDTPKAKPNSKINLAACASKRVVYKDIYTPKDMIYKGPELPEYNFDRFMEEFDERLLAAGGDPWEYFIFYLCFIFLIPAWLILRGFPSKMKWTVRFAIFLAVIIYIFGGTFYNTVVVGGLKAFMITLPVMLPGLIVIALMIIDFLRRKDKVKCPECRKWAKVTRKDAYVTKHEGDDLIFGGLKYMRACLGNTLPVSKTEDLGGGNSQTRITSETWYALESEMRVYDHWVVSCRCKRCGAEWNEVEKRPWKELIRGPIIYQSYLNSRAEFIEETILRHESGPEEVIDRRHVTDADRRRKYNRHYDYEHYEPYYKRFIAGDKNALDEYYNKYWIW